LSNLKESASNEEDTAMVKMLLEDHAAIIIQLRKVIEKANAAGG